MAPARQEGFFHPSSFNDDTDQVQPFKDDAMIASRTLQTRLGPLRVELDAPQGPSTEMYCHYRILGPRTRKQGKVSGVDGIQVLQLAMERIGIDLRMSPEFEAGPLMWFDMADPGFPMPANVADLGWGQPAASPNDP